MLDKKTQTLRAFFGISLPTSLQNLLESLQRNLTLQEHNLRWTCLENLHITLKFLGSLNPNEIPAIIDALSQEFKKMDAFYLQLDSLTLFPSIKHPKILCMDLKFSKQCLMLVRILNETLQRFNYPVETRVFQGHVTLARFTTQTLQKNILKNIELPPLPDILVDKLCLFESRPKQLGSEYILLESIPLQFEVKA